jgi:hypothetical protein
MRHFYRLYFNFFQIYKGATFIQVAFLFFTITIFCPSRIETA